ncbi:phage tail tube protein [Prauserella endophytica]|uniref:Phage tail protein n=1 Tax=Prauserella endophytica TaxID=1592324 RepID=A0ABY2RST3_9PSEU|nr:hypothetical protein [Prauserella endophytica]TKG58898.1 hypothetical protein FCN18_37430 [Prauserella endophytica]
MATPALSTSTRYFDPEVTKCYFVPTIANKTSPTRVEMDAGTDLTDEIADLSGWMVAGEAIPTPDLGSRFTSNIPGRTQAEDSSLTFYSDQEGVDVRAVLPRDTNGFVVWLDGGDTPGNKMDVFPVRVLSNGKQRNLQNEAAKIQVQFAITSQPAENVTVPALT